MSVEICAKRAFVRSGTVVEQVDLACIWHIKCFWLILFWVNRDVTEDEFRILYHVFLFEKVVECLCGAGLVHRATVLQEQKRALSKLLQQLFKISFYGVIFTLKCPLMEPSDPNNLERCPCAILTLVHFY